MNRENANDYTFEGHNELQLMEVLEDNPETTQADLAAKAGVAVGTVNWYLKRWSAKGLVKVKRIGRWRWRYLLTPQGMAEKADLTSRYFQASMRIYRRTRADSKRLLSEVQSAGYESVVIEGEGDVAEIVELTCLELGMSRIRDVESIDLPQIIIDGLRIEVIWPGPEV